MCKESERTKREGRRGADPRFKTKRVIPCKEITPIKKVM